MRICALLLICVTAQAGYCPLEVQYERAGQGRINHAQACCIYADADWVYFVTAIHPFVGTSGTPVLKLMVRNNPVPAELRWTAVQNDLAVIRCRAFANPKVFVPYLPAANEPLQIWNQRWAALPARFYRPRLCYGVVIPGDSGGPIVSAQGKLVGVILASTQIEESACVGGSCLIFGAQLNQRRSVPAVEYADANDIAATWQEYRAWEKQQQPVPAPYERTVPPVTVPVPTEPVTVPAAPAIPFKPAPAEVRPPLDDPVVVVPPVGGNEPVHPGPTVPANPSSTPPTVHDEQEQEGSLLWKLWPWVAVAGIGLATGGVGVPWALKAWSAAKAVKTVAGAARDNIGRLRQWRGRRSPPAPPVDRSALQPPAAIHQQVVEVEKDNWRRAILYGMRHSAMKYPDRAGVLNYLEQQVNQYMGQQLVQHPDEAWSSS